MLLNRMKNGDNKAKTKIAWFQLSGHAGVPIDEDNAVALLEERVKDKDPEAMWLLGLCYEYGLGCEQDLTRAEYLYWNSCECGNDVGEFLDGNGRHDRGTGKMIARSSLCLLLTNEIIKTCKYMIFFP